MKVNPFTIAIHALVWVLLLVIPYVSTDQVFNSLDPCIGHKISFTLFYFKYRIDNNFLLQLLFSHS